MKDLYADTVNNIGIAGFDLQKTCQLSYNNISTDTNVLTNNYSVNDIISSNQKHVIENDVGCDDDVDYDYDDNHGVKENDIREVWKKLKVLQHNLHLNNICDKKSACFWCTYEFDKKGDRKSCDTPLLKGNGKLGFHENFLYSVLYSELDCKTLYIS